MIKEELTKEQAEGQLNFLQRILEAMMQNIDTPDYIFARHADCLGMLLRYSNASAEYKPADVLPPELMHHYFSTRLTFLSLMTEVARLQYDASIDELFTDAYSAQTP